MKGKSNTTRSIACWLGSLAVAALGAECYAGDEQPLNVIVVMTDDQGYPDLGVHGNPDVRTPNMDALAAQSVRLTDFHVNPFCSPGRWTSRPGSSTGRTSESPAPIMFTPSPCRIPDARSRRCTNISTNLTPP